MWVLGSAARPRVGIAAQWRVDELLATMWEHATVRGLASFG